MKEYSWDTIAIGDKKVCMEIHPGFACGTKDVQDGVPHLRMNNISANGNPDFSLIRRIPQKIAENRNRWLQIGDILFCNTNSTELVGKTCLFSGFDEQCAYSNHLTRLRCNIRTVLPEWLTLCLQQLWSIKYFALNCKEFVGQSAFSNDKLKKIEIPVPPLNEQRRIVARIEELIHRAEEARKLRQEAVEKVKGLFQTELERIFITIETDDWTEYDAREVFDIVKGQIDPREEPYASMPHVAPDAIEVGTGRLLMDKIKSAAELELKSGKYSFNASHILYSKIRPNLRKVALPNFAGTCSADMYPLIPNTEVVTREFLALVLLSPPFTTYAVENSDRNAMPKVNRPTMFGYRVKLPEKSEQEEIVFRLRAMQEKAEEIIGLQNDVDEELAKFQIALLAKAFRGKLA